MRIFFILLLSCLPSFAGVTFGGGGTATSGAVTTYSATTTIFQMYDFEHLYIQSTNTGVNSNPYTRMDSGFVYAFGGQHCPAWTNSQGKMVWMMAYADAPSMVNGGSGAIGVIMTDKTGTNTLYYDNEGAYQNYIYTNSWIPNPALYAVTGAWNPPNTVDTNYYNDSGISFQFGTNYVTNCAVRTSGVYTNNDVVVDPVNGDDTKASPGGFAFKTIQIASFMAPDGAHWHFKSGTNNVNFFIWTPVNAKIDCDQGAYFYADCWWVNHQFLIVGSCDWKGGQIEQHIGYGFTDPSIYFASQCTNYQTFDSINITSDFGCMQSKDDLQINSITVTVKNSTLEGGSFVYEDSQFNTTSYITGNTIGAYAWNPERLFGSAIPLCLRLAKLSYVTGNSFILSNTVAGQNASFVAISVNSAPGSNSVCYASGNSYSELGTTTNCAQYNPITVTSKIYVNGPLCSTNKMYGIITNVISQVVSSATSFGGVDMPTNALGTHGYTGYFTNGLFVTTGTY